VWLPEEPLGMQFVMPHLSVGERLQGLPAGWTGAARTERASDDHRWKLVGNAVTTNVAAWAGRRVAGAIHGLTQQAPAPLEVLDRTAAWPHAGWGERGQAWRSSVSAWPKRQRYHHLRDMVDLDQATPLSYRATAGFRSRLEGSGNGHPPSFLRDLIAHEAYMKSRLPC
jgi:DNA (cytosine-5)-methyltransferase 1